MTPPYHIPVLLHASIEALITDPSGIYVDATFGGGGHSREIIKHLSPQGKLFCFDRDPDAAKNFDHAFSATNATFIPQNFRNMQKFLRLEGITKVHGILADLGVSSHQFDTPERGFSTRFDAELDMRMSQDGSLSAVEILNTWPADKLQEMFGRFGEVRNAKQLANAIIRKRSELISTGGISTTGILRSIATEMAKGDLHTYLAQVFQAIRIAVNEELDALEALLVQSASLLHAGGRLVIISYHSLEDRMVKNMMKTGNIQGEIIEDIKGRKEFPFTMRTRKPVMATEAEVQQNTRARSARMRVAEKI